MFSFGMSEVQGEGQTNVAANRAETISYSGLWHRFSKDNFRQGSSRSLLSSKNTNLYFADRSIISRLEKLNEIDKKALDTLNQGNRDKIEFLSDKPIYEI